MIYKYRKLEESDITTRLIIEGELYFSSPDEFNDPFDSRITYDFNSLSDDEVKLYLTKLQRRNDLIGRNPELTKIYLENLFKNRIKLQELSDLTESEVLNKKIGIFSSSKFWDNLLMWSHYADHHKGIVVGLNEKRIINDNSFLICGDVQYLNDNVPPKLLPSMDDPSIMHVRFFHKAKDWSYENEFRLLNDLDPKSFERKVFCPESIEEITFGFSVNHLLYPELIDFCKSKGIKIFKANKVPSSISITRREI